jgi:DNA-binding transcriptional ArsR family regulator
MVKYSRDLNTVFGALADPTRRGVIAALAGGPRTIGELAQPYPMSLPGFMKHVAILEQAGLLRREKSGRVVQCTLEADAMKDASDWLDRMSQFWNERLDALGRYLEKENTAWQPQSQPSPRSPSSASTRPRRKKSGRR